MRTNVFGFAQRSRGGIRYHIADYCFLHIRIDEVHASPAGAEWLFYFEIPAAGAGARRLAVIFCAAGRSREATEGDLGCESTASVAREGVKERTGTYVWAGCTTIPVSGRQAAEG
ncbi:hypothetical protein MRX96_041526 [Rhipicephalus microplus]